MRASAWLAPGDPGARAPAAGAVSVGGEYGASATYLSEMAGRERRGFFSSFQYVTLISGQLIALAVLLILQRVMPRGRAEAWGWRIPFAIGGVLARGRLLHPPRPRRDRELRECRRRPSSAAIQRLRCSATIPGGAAGDGADRRRHLAFYAYTTYLQKFLVNTSGFSRETATQITAAALFLFMLRPAGWPARCRTGSGASR